MSLLLLKYHFFQELKEGIEMGHLSVDLWVAFGSQKTQALALSSITAPLKKKSHKHLDLKISNGSMKKNTSP